jgi:hypothetical protein
MINQYRAWLAEQLLAVKIVDHPSDNAVISAEVDVDGETAAVALSLVPQL